MTYRNTTCQSFVVQIIKKIPAKIDPFVFCKKIHILISGVGEDFLKSKDEIY